MKKIKDKFELWSTNTVKKKEKKALESTTAREIKFILQKLTYPGRDLTDFTSHGISYEPGPLTSGFLATDKFILGIKITLRSNYPNWSIRYVNFLSLVSRENSTRIVQLKNSVFEILIRIKRSEIFISICRFITRKIIVWKYSFW